MYAAKKHRATKTGEAKTGKRKRQIYNYNLRFEDAETVETVSDFIFWGSKITADGDCSHEIERRLLLGRKVMTNLVAYSKAETLLC